MEFEPVIQEVIDEEDDLYGLIEKPKDEKQDNFYLNFLSEEIRSELMAKAVEVQVLFDDRRFIMTFLTDNHDFMVKVFETLYYEGKLNSELFKHLVESGYVKLTEEEITYFKKIGLIQVQSSNGGNGSSLT